jgi:mRNA interferase RelE/StbE
LKLKISYSSKSLKFLSRNQSVISESNVEELIIKAIKIIYKLEIIAIDVKRLKGEYKNYFRIRKGDLRIIFRVYRGEIYIAEIHDIDFRGNVY